MEWKKAMKKPIIVEYREPEPMGCYMMRHGESTAIPVEKVVTREGELYAFPGEDYVIKGIEGELYPIKKSIFNKTYYVYDENGDPYDPAVEETLAKLGKEGA